jgi:hypothetical protein
VWLLIEAMVPDLTHKCISLYSNNSPSVSWLQRLVSRRSTIAMQLIRALALRLQLRKVSPLTTLHIAGHNNQMTVIPSRYFGSNPMCACDTDANFTQLYNSLFPLPKQNSWNVFCFSNATAPRVISVLLMQHFTMDEWRCLPKLGRCIGPIGPSLSHLWAWTHTSTGSPMNKEYDSSQDTPPQSTLDTMAEDARSQLLQSVWQSRPLAR